MAAPKVHHTSDTFFSLGSLQNWGAVQMECSGLPGTFEPPSLASIIFLGIPRNSVVLLCSLQGSLGHFLQCLCPSLLTVRAISFKSHLLVQDYPVTAICVRFLVYGVHLACPSYLGLQKAPPPGINNSLQR